MRNIKTMDGRSNDQLRDCTITINNNSHAMGSCYVNFGNTQVLCSATVEEKVPRFLKHTGKGWISAEYSMLPSATHTRNQRERERISGRTMEIQRLIGRSLRTSVNLGALGERQILVDCDVIHADGGTRTASITGGFVALYIALKKLHMNKKIAKMPIKHFCAAISCGIIGNEIILDLDYKQDSSAMVDANFVMNDQGQIIEVQANGEEATFSIEQMQRMLVVAEKGIAELIAMQKQCLGVE